MLTFINCWDVKWAIRTQTFFTTVKLIGLAIIIITGFVQLGKGISGKHYSIVRSKLFSLICFLTGRTRNFDSAFSGSTKDIGDISIAFYSAVFAYSGWNSLNFVAEELHDPERYLLTLTSSWLMFVSALGSSSSSESNS